MASNDDPTTTIDEPELDGYEKPSPGGWQDYPLDELGIREEKRTAEDVVRRIEKGRFVLDPDFQRGFVWKIEKQSRLIESILMRIPLPVFYVAEDPQGRLVVVDGRQRLTTLQRFINGQLKLDLPDRPTLHRKHFRELEVSLQNRVEDCQLLFYIIDHAVPEQARLDIFERVNGGEKLTRQQMRNAIYNGPATVFLREEAEQPLFIEATGKSLSSPTMLDREFVNRFCSFSLFPLSEYKGSMDDWLARGLKHMNAIGDGERERIRQQFRRGLHNNLAVFGKHAFRKHKRTDQPRSVLNASLYDVMITGLSRIDERVAVAHTEALRRRFYACMDDERFIKSITYGPNSPKEVRTRFEVAAQMFGEVFGAS